MALKEKLYSIDASAWPTKITNKTAGATHKIDLVNAVSKGSDIEGTPTLTVQSESGGKIYFKVSYDPAADASPRSTWVLASNLSSQSIKFTTDGSLMPLASMQEVNSVPAALPAETKKPSTAPSASGTTKSKLKPRKFRIKAEKFNSVWGTSPVPDTFKISVTQVQSGESEGSVTAMLDHSDDDWAYIQTKPAADDTTFLLDLRSLTGTAKQKITINASVIEVKEKNIASGWGDSSSGDVSSRGGERSGSGGSTERDTAATAPAAPGLGEFLYKHATFAFGGIPNDVSMGRNTTAAALAKNVQSGEYKWGPAQRLATVGFASACKSKGTFYAYLEDSKKGIGAGLDDIIRNYSGGQGEPSGWGGATVAGQEFASSDDGLRDFLRLAYVASRAGGEQSGFDAAGKMGVTPAYSDYLPTDPLWQKMCVVGCISPATFIYLISPVNLSAGEVATLSITPEGGKVINVPVRSPSGRAAFLISMGIDATAGPIMDDSTNFTPLIQGDEAEALARAISSKSQVTFGLNSNRGNYGSVNVQLTSMGQKIQLADATVAPGASAPAPGAGGASGSPRTSTDMLAQSGVGNYRFGDEPGRGETGEVELVFLNYIKKSNGAIEQNPINANLRKRISGGNDVFTLTAGTAAPGYILIPIETPGLPATGETDVSGAATWALAAAGATSAGTVGFSYFPVKSIEWVFRGMHETFGGTRLPDILAIDVDPADVNADEVASARGISVYRKRRGDEELIRAAWERYLATTENVVGMRIYKTRGLAEALNSFYRRVRRSF